MRGDPLSAAGGGRTRRRGFTLIELLVVISIIGVLVGLVLPAIQASRESARRLQCTNNLKQIGIAVHSYMQHHGGMPPGYRSTYDVQNKKEVGPGWGWASKLLPDLEQRPLYDQIQFDLKIQDPANQTVRTRALAVFLCPSDNMDRVWTAKAGTVWMDGFGVHSSELPICDVAASNYVGNFGIGEPGVDGEGVFYRDSFVRPIDITDGLTHTMCAGERSVNLNAGRGYATWTGAVPGARLWSCVPDPFDPDAGTCRSEEAAGMILGHTGEGNGPGSPMGDVNQFLSRHGRGCFFLFCDGRVEFLKASIDYKLYKALSTRDWGEVTPDGY